MKEELYMLELKEIKNELRKVILERDKEYYKEGNVVYAKNAFLINSVLSWYFNQGEESGLNVSHVSSILDLLDKHINKEVILSWEGNNLQILSPKTKKAAKKNESAKNSRK